MPPSREDVILSVASDYLIGQERPGGKPGIRYVRVDSPEAIRRTYLTAAGYGSLVSDEEATGVEIDLTRAAYGVLGIKLWIHDRPTLNRLKRIVDLSSLPLYVATEGKGVLDPWGFLAKTTLRDAGTHRSREQRLDPRAVAAGLGVYYLSRGGGGRRTINQAAQIFECRIGVHPEHYIAGWPSTYHRLIRNLRQRLGPLTPVDAESHPENLDDGLTSRPHSRSDI